jgi:hypothetical protein
MVRCFFCVWQLISMMVRARVLFSFILRWHTNPPMNKRPLSLNVPSRYGLVYSRAFL